MRNFIKRPKALYKAYPLLALALLAIPVSANAALVTWSFDNVVFGDGGTASGSFVYDASTNAFSSIEVTSTAGSPGSEWTSGASYAYAGSDSGSQILKFYSDPSIESGVTKRLYIWLWGYMTDAGGTIEIRYIYEGLCTNAECYTFSDTPDPRNGNSNPDDVITSNTAPVPLPAAAWLLLSGLGGLGLLRRRKAA